MKSSPILAGFLLANVALLGSSSLSSAASAAEQNTAAIDSPASVAKATGAAAWQQVVGNTIIAQARGGGYTEYYAPDGGVTHLDKDGRSKGRWTLEHDRVCFEFPEEDDRSCVTVEMEGSKGTFVDEDAERDAFDVLPGNAKGL